MTQIANRTQSSPARLFVAALALSSLLGLLGCQGFLTATYEKSLGPSEGEISLPGIEKGAVIRRDALGIPVIEADNLNDCMFANGYADAADRLGQMVGQTLTAQGRLSEMAGKDALDIDVFMRSLNLKKRAEEALAAASPELRQALSAYSRGVNAFLWTRDKLPPDLSLAGFRPDPWRPVDSCYVFLLLDLGLATNMGEELAYLNVAKKLGPQKAAWLVPIYPDQPIPFSEAEKTPDLSGLETSGLETLRQKMAAVVSLGVAASNNWAVSKERTAGGASILSNDTHLPLSLPSLWKLVHLRCPGLYDAAGIAAPGIPGVVAGYNGSLAWGMTMVMADNQDIFLEKLSTRNGKLHYLYKGEWRPVTERSEVFRVKGEKPVTRVIRETVHGPLLNEALSGPSKMMLVPEPVSTSYGVALSWAYSPTDTTFDAFMSLGRAKTMEEARSALNKVTGMALNMVYADRDNIAWQVTGLYPVRAKGLGLLPSPGWTGRYDWTGVVPTAALPFVENPAAGFLATANARTVDAGYPYVLTSSWFSPERVERIDKVLCREKAFTAEKSMSLQYDQVSNLVPKLQRILFNSDLTDQITREIASWSSAQQQSRAREALARLRTANGDLSADRVDAAVLAAFFHSFIINTFADELGPVGSPLWQSFMALGDASYNAQEDHLLVRGDESPFFDNVKTPEKETKAQIMARSLADAVELLENRLGPDRNEWRWGRLHTYYFETDGSKLARHMEIFTRMGMRALSGYFNVGPFPAGGDNSTVNVAGYRQGQDFDTWLIPEMRMVVDFSRKDPLFIMNSTGQSGNPASPNYEDGIRAWLSGRYTNMPFAPADIAAAYPRVLKLSPKY